MTGYFSNTGSNNYCESCEEELDFDWHMVLCGDHEEGWCSLCIDAASFICDGCLEYVSDHDFHAIDGNAYCDECYEKSKTQRNGGGNSMSETITKFETRLYMPTTFTHLRERVKAYYEDDRKEGKLFIQNGWSDSYDNMSDRDIGLERYSTDTRWSAYKAGRLDRESAVKLAYKRRLKEIEKLEQAELAHVESVEKAGELVQAYVTVEWRRSKTWGMNPIASIKCTYLDENMNQLDDTRVGELASGCGYDKHSTALASVFNRCPHMLKPMYQRVEEAIAENPDARIKEILGYGTGYRETPYFEGGVGVNCHRRIFESLGYDWHDISSTSTSDVHVINARKKVT